ncbi:uncharacterized protein LOC112526402 [Cynara cardunculus var. scolymus]|uniref:uncharacterized protein LOC112526402 n=1 Tax=Cynara cardunculus var. scolymus TaxID=59895 RepID=UPI000D62C6F4|nr:uncharacterized protein LOC112526402 [Cynara cardunculus var. scolymus]
MPSYAKFLKDILSKKKKLTEYETVALTEGCSALLTNSIPPKLKDPGSFTIPCSIGGKEIGKALCDLESSINLMPLYVFNTLGIGEARPTTVTLQLANKSIAYPKGKIEDVLVQVDKFIFLADFIILDFEADKDILIILGRPFLATERTLIDVQKGELTMRLQDQKVTFNVFNCIKYPDYLEECSRIDEIEEMCLEEGIQRNLKLEGEYDEEIEEESIEEIEEIGTDVVPEKKLVDMLKLRKKALGWTIADLKGISPFICQHKIILEDKNFMSIEPQRRLNPVMKESLERCEETDLVINWEKCHFMVKEGIVLGHLISKRGVEVDKAKLEHDQKFNFNDECINAFKTLKKALVTAPVVVAPDWNKPFEIMCDASDWAVGAVLGQRKEKVFHSIYYATIKYLISKKDAKPRLIRWVLLLQEFNLEILDRKGIENQVADHLSRLEEPEKEGLDINDTFPDERILMINQPKTPWFADLANFLACGIKPSDYTGHMLKKFFHDAKSYLWDDPFLFRLGADQILRRCVPESEVAAILHHCHHAPYRGHFGGQRTATKVLQSGAVDLVNPEDNSIFKVNGQRVKVYHDPATVSKHHSESCVAPC